MSHTRVTQQRRSITSMKSVFADVTYTCYTTVTFNSNDEVSQSANVTYIIIGIQRWRSIQTMKSVSVDVTNTCYTTAMFSLNDEVSFCRCHIRCTLHNYNSHNVQSVATIAWGGITWIACTASSAVGAIHLHPRRNLPGSPLCWGVNNTHDSGKQRLTR